MNDLIELIKILAWPVAVIVGAAVVYSMRSRLASVTASKDGGLSLSMVEQRTDRRDEARYYMDRRVSEVDEALKTATRLATQDLRRPVLAAVAGSGLCTAALRAIASDLRAPIFHAVDENSFKTKLAVENREEYIAGKMGELQEEYEDLVEEASQDPCIAVAAAISFPPWEEVEQRLRRAIDTWADRIRNEVVASCRKKILIYQEYRPQFEDAKDTRFVGIVDNCIDKNRQYIEALTGQAEP